MTPEMVALGRRAVACKGWRWMGGMRRVWPFLVRMPILQGSVWSCLAGAEDRARGYTERMPSERVEDDPLSCEPSEKWDDATDQWVADMPDLTDPATLGCLLALVREAWNAPRAMVRLSANRKSFHVYDVDRDPMGGNWAAFLCGDHRIQTEAEALVAALEDAP